MAETFYSVLGVDSDADTATIKEAYREKVKTHHPDVSDESDAAEQFQRITEARDVLVDESDRSRYDRLGHDTYIRRHLDSTAWSAADTDSQRTRRGDQSNRSSSSASGGSTRSGRGSGPGGRGGAGRSERSSNRQRSNRTRSERTSRARSETNRASSTGTGTEDRAAWMGEDGWSTSNATDTASDSQRRARANGWREQHAASNVYSPTGRDTGVTNGVGESRFARLARGIGPWIVFHFVFLVSAFVTIFLLMSWSPTIPTMFGSLLLLGVAIFFSILHMVSRIYS
jgi:curved DNA-binding protein CbpA